LQAVARLSPTACKANYGQVDGRFFEGEPIYVTVTRIPFFISSVPFSTFLSFLLRRIGLAFRNFIQNVPMAAWYASDEYKAMSAYEKTFEKITVNFCYKFLWYLSY